MADEMALWCVLTRQPPDQYYRLTRLEREAFIRAVKQVNK